MLTTRNFIKKFDNIDTSKTCHREIFVGAQTQKINFRELFDIRVH